MSEERRRVLEMLAQGKISVAEAEQLLKAVGAADAAPAGDAASAASGASGARAAGAFKYLHVHVRKNSGLDDPATAGWASGWQGRWWARHQAHAGGWPGAHRAPADPASGVQYSRDVDVRIPLSLLRSGMKLAAFMPGRTGDVVSRKLKERGLDIDVSKLDSAQLEEVLGNLGELTVDLDGGRGQVRIFCE